MSQDAQKGTVARWWPWILTALLTALVFWRLSRSHFDWRGLLALLSGTTWWRLVLATLIVWSVYLIRAARWAIFLRATEPPVGARGVRWPQLVAPQFAGYAGLAIFGRLGEFIRPYLVARRTGRTFASQIAVVAVERVFDLLAFATVFSLDLIFSPGLKAMPYYGRLRESAWGIAALTVVLVLVLLGLRVAGEPIARSAKRVLRGRAAVFAEDKLLSFRQGLDVLDGWPDLLGVAGLSLLLWATNGIAYLQVMRAFPAPSLQRLGLAEMYVLMAFSIAGSVVQLPGVGGGSQVGTIGAMHLLLGLPEEVAVGAGVVLWLVTFMSVIPVGLLCARFVGVGLSDARGEAGREASAERV